MKKKKNVYIWKNRMLSHLFVHTYTLTHKNIPQKTSSGIKKLLFVRLKLVSHLSLQYSISNCY